MPVYNKNSTKNKEITYESKEQPGIVYHVPSRLGYGVRMHVRSVGSKVHIVPKENGEGNDVYQIVDNAAAQRALLIAALTDPRAWHNLTELDAFGQEKPIRIDQLWVETEMDENEAIDFGEYLYNEIGQDVGFQTASEDTPEGNVKEKPENESGTSEKPDSSSGPKTTHTSHSKTTKND